MTGHVLLMFFRYPNNPEAVLDTGCDNGGLCGLRSLLFCRLLSHKISIISVTPDSGSITKKGEVQIILNLKERYGYPIFFFFRMLTGSQWDPHLGFIYRFSCNVLVERYKLFLTLYVLLMRA